MLRSFLVAAACSINIDLCFASIQSFSHACYLRGYELPRAHPIINNVEHYVTTLRFIGKPHNCGFFYLGPTVWSLNEECFWRASVRRDSYFAAFSKIRCPTIVRYLNSARGFDRKVLPQRREDRMRTFPDAGQKVWLVSDVRVLIQICDKVEEVEPASAYREP